MLTGVVVTMIRPTLPPGDRPAARTREEGAARRADLSPQVQPGKKEREKERERGDTGFSKFLEANKKQIKLCLRPASVLWMG